MATIPRVIILGGGLAGLAAAVCLTEADFEVEIIEKRSVLGGRASSFSPPGETGRIDNCQHVLLGCCTNLLDFFRRTGTLNQFRFYSSFRFVGSRGTSLMSAAPLPEPLHLLPSLLRFRDLDWKDRWSIARAMRTILRNGLSTADEPMIEWLARQRQTPGAIENFWRVVLTSALNEDLERLSSKQAFKVFADGFLKNRRGYRMGVPAIPLTDLYSSQSLGQSCSVRTGVMAASIEFAGGDVRGICLREGERKTADFYISAVPPDALYNLLPEEIRNGWPAIVPLKNAEWSPITGIHLWFDRPVLKIDHAAIVGRNIQWVFNRTLIGHRDLDSGSQYIQLVVSASRAFLNMKRDEILELCLRELGELFPSSKQAKLQNAVIVKEAKSTLSPYPGIDELRPGSETPFANFFIAGDWTATGWPFTMESAVRSGYRAAELVMAAAGRARAFLQPDLPTAPLVRWLGKF